MVRSNDDLKDIEYAAALGAAEEIAVAGGNQLWTR